MMQARSVHPVGLPPRRRAGTPPHALTCFAQQLRVHAASARRRRQCDRGAAMVGALGGGGGGSGGVSAPRGRQPLVWWLLPRLNRRGRKGRADDVTTARRALHPSARAMLCLFARCSALDGSCQSPPGLGWRDRS
eukprot:363363-Chlamydomonas_euryale.AAC.12